MAEITHSCPNVVSPSVNKQPSWQPVLSSGRRNRTHEISKQAFGFARIYHQILWIQTMYFYIFYRVVANLRCWSQLKSLLYNTCVYGLCKKTSGNRYHRLPFASWFSTRNNLNYRTIDIWGIHFIRQLQTDNKLVIIKEMKWFCYII